MKIQSIQVTRTITYSPDAYLDYCKESDEEPTQEGFLDYIEDWIYDDFANEMGVQSIQLID